MYAGLSNTVSSVRSRAVFQHRDMSSVPMADFLAAKTATSIKGQENIEAAAISFYLSNHGFHLIEAANAPTEELSPEHAMLAKEHVVLTSKMGMRMLFYILTIAAEEAALEQERKPNFFDFVESATSPDAAKWLKMIMERSDGRGGMLGSEKTCGKATLGQCVKALELCFRFGRWSYGCGSLPWAIVTETAGEVIRGTNSLELMVDKAFTLCHNNGAIFNKGHQFTRYVSDFYAILDIQASGQIPSAIAAGLRSSGFDSPVVKAIHQKYAKAFPEEFNKKYDPSLIKSMEEVRVKKDVALKQKTRAFIGISGGAAAGAPAGPPRRACDDLFSAEDLSLITGIPPASKKGF